MFARRPLNPMKRLCSNAPWQLAKRPCTRKLNCWNISMFTGYTHCEEEIRLFRDYPPISIVIERIASFDTSLLFSTRRRGRLSRHRKSSTFKRLYVIRKGFVRTFRMWSVMQWFLAVQLGAHPEFSSSNVQVSMRVRNSHLVRCSLCRRTRSVY